MYDSSQEEDVKKPDKQNPTLCQQKTNHFFFSIQDTYIKSEKLWVMFFFVWFVAGRRREEAPPQAQKEHRAHELWQWLREMQWIPSIWFHVTVVESREKLTPGL